jgi:hypothetical protein
MDRLYRCSEIILIILIFNTANTFANEAVNVLSWWGYLSDKSQLAKIEQKCGTKISVDEYYSNSEFIRRWNNSNVKYEVLLYSNTVHNFIKDQVANKGKDISQILDDYNPNIKKKYLSRNYSNNTALFVLSFTGFLWNKKSIQINKKQTISDIFKISKNKRVLLLDDYLEISRLIKASEKNNENPYDQLLSLTNDSKVYVTNMSDGLISRDDFAFAYIWSGEAMGKLPKYKNMEFLIHPKLSHVSYDLVSLISKDDKATCVAKELTGKSFLSYIQGKYAYLSPFAVTKDFNKNKSKKFLSMLLEKVDDLHWLEPAKTEDYHQQDKLWKRAKLKLMKRLKNSP